MRPTSALAAAVLLSTAACTDAPAPTAAPSAAITPGYSTTYPAAWPALTGGRSHTCAISSDWTVRCWGFNRYGQLGVGDRTQASRYERPVPVQVATSVLFKAVTAWSFNTCGLDRDGRLYCWGKDFLPPGVTNDVNVEGSPTPTLIESPAPFKSISRNCGLTTTNEVYCWENASGAVTRVSGMPSGETWTALAVGEGHHCTVTSYGNLVCWGANHFGQLGRGFTSAYEVDEDPWYVEVPSPTMRTVTAGSGHTCARTSRYEAYCWGDGFYGQLGGSPAGSSLPRRVGGTNDLFLGIAAGSDYTCGIRKNETLADTTRNVSCWGKGDFGQLGFGGTTGSYGTYVPQTVLTARSGGGMKSIMLANSGAHTCGIDKVGDVYCWGYNTYGQVGNTAGGNVLSPRRVEGLPKL